MSLLVGIGRPTETTGDCPSSLHLVLLQIHLDFKRLSISSRVFSFSLFLIRLVLIFSVDVYINFLHCLFSFFLLLLPLSPSPCLCFYLDISISLAYLCLFIHLWLLSLSLYLSICLPLSLSISLSLTLHLLI